MIGHFYQYNDFIRYKLYVQASVYNAIGLVRVIGHCYQYNDFIRYKLYVQVSVYKLYVHVTWDFTHVQSFGLYTYVGYFHMGYILHSWDDICSAQRYDSVVWYECWDTFIIIMILNTRLISVSKTGK